MKKYVAVLMALIVACMFFSCDNGGSSEEETTVTLNRTTVNLEVTVTTTITATTNPAGKAVTWTSSAPAIASVANGKVTGVAPGTATITATADGKSATCNVTVKAFEPYITLNLNPANWGDVPASLQGVGTADDSWPGVLAAASYANNALTLTYNGKNRQRGIIPLTTEQIEKFTSTTAQEADGVTFRFNATVTLGTTIPSGMEYFTPTGHAGFRVHLGNQTIVADNDAGINYNATATGLQTPFYGLTPDLTKDHLVEFRAFEHAYDQATLEQNFKSVMIQAMFVNSAGSNGNSQALTFPEVKLNITSLRIDIGDTRTAAEKPAE